MFPFPPRVRKIDVDHRHTSWRYHACQRIPGIPAPDARVFRRSFFSIGSLCAALPDNRSQCPNSCARGSGRFRCTRTNPGHNQHQFQLAPDLGKYLTTQFVPRAHPRSRTRGASPRAAGFVAWILQSRDRVPRPRFSSKYSPGAQEAWRFAFSKPSTG